MQEKSKSEQPLQRLTNLMRVSLRPGEGAAHDSVDVDGIDWTGWNNWSKANTAQPPKQEEHT